MKKYISKFSAVSIAVMAVSILLYSLCIRFVTVADFVNSTVSVAMRFLLASLTNLLPFSLFEILIILSPVLLVTVIVIAVKKGNDCASRLRGITALFGVISLLATSYIFTLGVGYHTTAVAEKIGISADKDISKEQLYDTLNIIVDEINLIADDVDFDGKESYMAYSIDNLNREIVSAYDTLNETYPLVTNYNSAVKPVYFSTVMSDLGISGIYSFFTGEANVNVEYPDYCLPFTAAHEMAHQRGVGREDEANFVAFLVCTSSSDTYLRYSAYLNMYEYLASALYRADKEMYIDVVSRLSRVAIADMIAADEVYQKHKDSPLGRLNTRLNDAYLKANGTDGIVSYNYVVELVVEYYTQNNK